MAEEVSEAWRVSVGLMLADADLTAIVGTHVYQHAAPQGIVDRTEIYILGTFLSGEDITGGGGVRLATDSTILWRAVKAGQPNAALAEADRLMDKALTNVRAETSGGFVFSIVRESPFQRALHDEALNLYAEAGGFYSYFISPGQGS